ncbi:hypothetical protein VTJ04DRAFT_6167 [Mycothermus thermophilus]|uniref:uncharacterized protein n=1 Tax=Humicola insolens TaxID=85995 RepID=UPI003743D709
MSSHPQTPQSPSQFSPNVSDLTMSMTGSAASTTTTLPTPAHSVNGSSLTQDTVMSEDSPQHKRKREIDDMGDRAQKKVQVEDRSRRDLDNLHLDVGEKYLLCRTPHPKPRPPISEDLFERYGLQGLASEVARVLPNGEKNALRKTYKGHIKKLGVQGHWDEVKEDPHREFGLLYLMKLPQDVWDSTQVRGRDIRDGFSNEVRQKMLKAMTMSRGVVPRTLWDSSVLGDMAPGKADKLAGSARPTAPNTPLPTAAGGVPGGIPRPKVSTPQFAQDRAKRNIKKRSYGDSSFEGYGEGFPDDDAGYSTGEGEGQKRRKKVLINS